MFYDSSDCFFNAFTRIFVFYRVLTEYFDTSFVFSPIPIPKNNGFNALCVMCTSVVKRATNILLATFGFVNRDICMYNVFVKIV